MNVDEQDFAAQLGRERNRLLTVARSILPAELRPKMDASDLVQETLTAAWEAHDGFRDENPGQLENWLDRILERKLCDAIRKWEKAEKRRVRREVSIEAAIKDATTRLGSLLPAHQSTPSGEARRAEMKLAVTNALNRLANPKQRMAVELCHIGGFSMAVAANEIKRCYPEFDGTPAGVAGLLRRGLAALRRELSDHAGNGMTPREAEKTK